MSEIKELKITPPEGYEIDSENSTFECIKFKPIKKTLTYKDIARELFMTKETFWPTSYGDVNSNEYGVKEGYSDATNCTSEKQVRKLLAINKLMNVAKYLNGAWKPDWRTSTPKYYLNLKESNIGIDCDYSVMSKPVYFKTIKLAEQSVEILGEDTIRLALSTNW